MSYSRSKKITPEEKKLDALKLQLYGKESLSPLTYQAKKNLTSSDPVIDHPAPLPAQQAGHPLHNDSSLLKKDLLKTVALALIILVIQLSLYFGQKQSLINF